MHVLFAFYFPVLMLKEEKLVSGAERVLFYQPKCNILTTSAKHTSSEKDMTITGKAVKHSTSKSH